MKWNNWIKMALLSLVLLLWGGVRGVAAREYGDGLRPKNVTTNKVSHEEVTIKYEYQRLIRYYLYNDAQLDQREREILDHLAEKWGIDPEEKEELIKEAQKGIAIR